MVLKPLPEAIKNGMPEIMAVIKNAMARSGIDFDSLPEADKKALAELPKMIPKLVQNRVLQKRKAQLSVDN